MVEVTVLGISLNDESGIPLLLLHPPGSMKILPLRIGTMEAFAISNALGRSELIEREPQQDKNGLSFPRPLTHDLMFALVKALGGSLLRVEIISVHNGVYKAEAVLLSGRNQIRVDCRPSDGIALALRCRASINISVEVLAQCEDFNEVIGSLPEQFKFFSPPLRNNDTLKLDQTVKDASAQLSKSFLEFQKELSIRPDNISSDAVSLEHIERILAKVRSWGEPADSSVNIPSSEPMDESLNRGKKTLEQKQSGRLSVVTGKLPDVSLTDGSYKNENTPEAKNNGSPRITVSLIRQNSKGEPEVLDEVSIGQVKTKPENNLELMAMLLRSGDKRHETYKRQSLEDNLTELLRAIAPETKVLM